MAQTSIPLRTWVKFYVSFFFIALFFLLAPVLIEAYYPAAAPVAAVCVWFTETFACGFTSLTLMMAITMLSMLGSDFRGWVMRVWARRASPATGPIALEDGIATPAPAPTDADATAEAPAAKAEATTPPTITSKLVSLTSCSSFFARNLFTADVVALDRPVLDNIGATALYILRGFEVLFAVFLGLVFVAYVKQQRAAGVTAGPATEAQAPVQPVQVLVDVVVEVKDEKERLKQEEAEKVAA
ncbi:hypothetical protein C8R44DRAFT_759576 [Mycena epipterygia]|nr:hypothetical protein C8R44DRAFT_759576 [Mycena epipterygia]